MTALLAGASQRVAKFYIFSLILCNHEMQPTRRLQFTPPVSHHHSTSRFCAGFFRPPDGLADAGENGRAPPAFFFLRAVLVEAPAPAPAAPFGECLFFGRDDAGCWPYPPPTFLAGVLTGVPGVAGISLPFFLAYRLDAAASSKPTSSSGRGK